jgi:hypothetical protein
MRQDLLLLIEKFFSIKIFKAPQRPQGPQIKMCEAAGDIAVFLRWCPCSCHAVHSFAERTDLCRHNSLSLVSLTPAITFFSRCVVDTS